MDYLTYPERDGDWLTINKHHIFNTVTGQLGQHVATILEYKAKLTGVTIIYVNPAHTSQTCNHCDHVSPENRKTQNLFTCTQCGHTTHADLNAAHNIHDKGVLNECPYHVEEPIIVEKSGILVA